MDVVSVDIGRGSFRVGMPQRSAHHEQSTRTLGKAGIEPAKRPPLSERAGLLKQAPKGTRLAKPLSHSCSFRFGLSSGFLIGKSFCSILAWIPKEGKFANI